MDSDFWEFAIALVEVTGVATVAGAAGVIRGNLSANEKSMSPTLDTLILSSVAAANCFIGARYGMKEGEYLKKKTKYGAIFGATAGAITVASYYIVCGAGYLFSK